MATLRSL